MTFRQFLTSRRLVFGITVVLLAGLGISMVLAVRGNAENASKTQHPSTQLLPVKVLPATKVSLFTQKRTYTGIVTARRTTDLAFNRPGGKIKKILVRQGSQVKRDQVLALLDTEELLAARDQLVAQQAEAQARLDQLRFGYRKEKIAAAKALVADLEAQVQLASADLVRESRAYNNAAGSQKDYDKARYTLSSMKSKLVNAKENWADLKKGYRKEEIRGQEAAVKRLVASIRSTDVQLRDSKLVAPYDGTISTRHLDEGAIVSPNMPVLRLVESTKLEFRVGLPTAAVLRLNNRQSHLVTVTNESYSATLSRKLPELDTKTRTREVIFDLDGDANDRIVPGQIARLTLEEQRMAKGFWFPSKALVRSTRGLWAVHVVKQGNNHNTGIVQRREVEVLYTEGARALVRGTVQPGDLVITTGVHRVVPKQQVRIVDR